MEEVRMVILLVLLSIFGWLPNSNATPSSDFCIVIKTDGYDCVFAKDVILLNFHGEITIANVEITNPAADQE